MGGSFTAVEAYLDERLRTMHKAEDVRRPQVWQKNLKPQIDTYVARISEHNPGPTAEAAGKDDDGGGIANADLDDRGSIESHRRIGTAVEAAAGGNRHSMVDDRRE